MTETKKSICKYFFFFQNQELVTAGQLHERDETQELEEQLQDLQDEVRDHISLYVYIVQYTMIAVDCNLPLQSYFHEQQIIYLFTKVTFELLVGCSIEVVSQIAQYFISGAWTFPGH